MNVLGPIDSGGIRLVLPQTGRDLSAGQWRSGQLVSARVIEILTAGRVILEIGQHRLEAETRVPLQSGQTIEARVAETGDKVVLQVVKDFRDGRAGLEDAGRRYLARRNEFTGALERLAKGDEAPGRSARGSEPPGRPSAGVETTDRGQPAARTDARAAVGRLLMETVLGPDKMAQGRRLVRQLARVGEALPRPEAADLARSIRTTLIEGGGPEAVGRLVRTALTKAGLDKAAVEDRAARLVTALAEGAADEPARILKAAVRVLGRGPEMIAARAGSQPADSTPRASGLEGLIRDLAAADLRTALGRLAGGAEEGASALIDTVRSGLEAQQAVTHQVWSQDGALLFFLPQSWGGRWSLIEFFVRREGSGGERGSESQGTNVVLFLDMSALGPVRIDARLRAEALSLRFTLAEEEAARALRQDFSQLTDELEALGFEIEFVGTFVRPREEVEAASPLAEIFQESGFHVVI
jgi:hypothetical protein